jgi:pyridoxamine 5'-phosphate oxidase
VVFEPFERDDPDTWHAVVWRLLMRACQDNTSALRHATVATHSEHGPEVRIMLLRQVDSQARSLTLFTDARSAKVTQLRHDARLALMFWAPHLHLQIRMRGTACLHQGNARAAAVHANIPEHAWRDYTSLVAPGTPAEQVTYAPGLLAQNFCLIDASVSAMDILALRHEHAGGHKRLHLNYINSQRSWLVP